MDYSRATATEIVAFAQGLVGRTIRSLTDRVAGKVSDATTKGDIGAVMERFFGLSANTRQGPDFEAAGIELKTVPMKLAGGSWRPKERTVITMIDYATICDTSWEASSLYKKTRQILFVFVAWAKDKPLDDFRVLDVHLWKPDDLDDAILRDAYEHVRERVRTGHAHVISEGDTPGVGACTKDSKALDRRQPFSSAPARRRAFAFKTAFTAQIWARARQARLQSVRDERVTTVTEFEERMLRRVLAYRGETMAAIARELGVTIPATRKDRFSVLARYLLGAKTGAGRVDEFERLGVTIRTVRVRQDLLPREHISFSPIDFVEVCGEEWESATFREQVSNIFFVVFQEDRYMRWPDTLLRSAFFWQPDAEEDDLLRREWESARALICQSRMSALPKASQTEAVHVRPHGRDSKDLRVLPNGTTWIKSSFWLNREFVRKLIRKHERTR